MTKENSGVCARRRKVLVVLLALGIVIFVVADYVLLRIGLGSVSLGHLRDIAVITIAILAVVVSLWQVSVTRKQARLSVRPFLDFSWNVHKPNELILLNGGLGPAIVTQMYVAVGENPLEPATDELWDDIKEELGFGQFDSSSFVGNAIISPNSQISVIKNLHSEYITLVERGNEDICQEKLRIKVAYKSAYGESFEVPTTLGKIPPGNPDT